MSNEPLLERIQHLERSVKRWRLVSLVLAFLLICLVAIGAIFTVIPPTQERGNFWLWLPWVRARREAEMQAMQEALRAAEAAKIAAEAAKRAQDEGVKKQP